MRKMKLEINYRVATYLLFTLAVIGVFTMSYCDKSGIRWLFNISAFVSTISSVLFMVTASKIDLEKEYKNKKRPK